MIKNIEDSFFYFLEEIPLNEIVFEEIKEIVKEYRKGNLEILKATREIKENSKEQIQNWLNQNKELNKIISEDF